MTLEKISDLKSKIFQCLNFSIFFDFEHICHEKSDRKLALEWARITLLALEYKCSTSHCFAQLRGEMAQEAPGEARRRPQTIKNMIFDRP